jgi:uncharacterized protein (TIGR00730 family)
MQAATQLGQTLACQGITLVYGGGRVGMMGALAKGALAADGKVIGVIPGYLMDEEVAFTDLRDLRVVGTMHERKALMAELADGFIALPGGLGTVEEFAEVLTWAQLGIHRKPCGLLNVCRYYDSLIDFLDTAVEQLFIDSVHRDMIVVTESITALLAEFEAYQPPRISKAEWIQRVALA